MSNSQPFSPLQISPRSYSKLPAIKQKEHGDILSVESNDFIKSSYSEDYMLTEKGESKSLSKPVNNLESGKDIFQGHINESNFATRKSNTKSLKPLVPINSSGDRSILNPIYNAKFQLKKADKIDPIKHQDPSTYSHENSDNFSSHHKDDFVKKINESNPNFLSQINYMENGQGEFSSSNLSTSFKIEEGQLSEHTRPKYLYEIPKVDGLKSVNSNSDSLLSKSLSPVRTFKLDTSPRSKDFSLHLLDNNQDSLQNRKEKMVKLPDFKVKVNLKSSEETTDTPTTYFYDLPKKKNSVEKTRNLKPNPNVNLSNKSLDMQSNYKSDYSSNKISPRIENIKGLHPIQMSHDKLEPKMEYRKGSHSDYHNFDQINSP